MVESGIGGKTPKDDIFDVDEYLPLDLDFPIPAATSKDDNILIPRLSGDGFTTKDALSEAYAAFIKNQRGKCPIEAVEKQLNVERLVLYKVLGSREDFLPSKNKDYIFTLFDQERILQDIFAKTRTKFVRASVLAEDHDIDLLSIGKLKALSKKGYSEINAQDLPLQLLNSPDQSPTKSLESGSSYVHTLPTLLALRKGVADRSTNAHTSERVAEWDRNEMYGLDIPDFARLAHKFAQESNGKEPLYGFFETGQDQVRYVTKSYLSRKVKRTLKQVAAGEVPYCDLEALTKKFPTLLPNIEAAKHIATTEVLPKDGNRYRWHFISHYAISEVSVSNSAKKCMEMLGLQRYLDTKPYVQAFPKAIQEDVQILLQDCTINFWRYYGGKVGAAMGLGEWLVLKTIISDIELAAGRIGRACAEDAFKRQMSNASLGDETERLLFLRQLHEESDLPVELLARLWNDERVRIKPASTASFDGRVAELQASGQTRLETMWKS